jgi:hypothetical protein
MAQDRLYLVAQVIDDGDLGQMMDFCRDEVEVVDFDIHVSTTASFDHKRLGR